MNVSIVYGSGGGNTELVCRLFAEKIASFSEVGFYRAKVFNWADLGAADVYVLASPTYGHGQLEKYMGKVVAKYSKEDFIVNDKKFLVIGLGDKKYDDDYFIESANILEDFVRKNGGKLILPAFKVGGCVYAELEERIVDYVAEFKKVYGK